MQGNGARLSRSVVDSIVEALAGEIRMGIMEPGEQLPSERMLCERFGTSRSSVREALRVLSSRRLIEIQMGRGSFVADFTAPAADTPLVFWEHNHDIPLAKLVEVRLTIEPQIAALASRHATEAHLDQLNTTLENMRSHPGAEGLGGRVFADIAFHDCLVRASSNPLYLSIYRGIEPMLFDVRRIGLRSAERSEKVLDMHEQIYRAVCDRDPAAASDAMWSHLFAFVSDMGLNFDTSSLGLLPRTAREAGD